MRKKDLNHPAHKYAVDVVAGKHIVSSWVLKCCERYLDDLDSGAERGLVFKPERGNHAIEFFSFLKHSKGEWAGEAFVLEPWQKFILWNLFGWYRKNGTRRFRVAYIEVARKNGKSTLLAGIGLYLFFADREPGAEVYSAATTRDQSKIVFSEASRMVRSSPDLSGRIQVFQNNLSVINTASKFEPLSSDYNSMDGLNVHGAIIDELHAHKTRDLWDVIETATGSRRQPLLCAITTAGHNRESICGEQKDYSEKVLDGIIKDDTFFAYVACIEKGDDWRDEKVWIKANPNLGVSVKIDDIRRLADSAARYPAKQNAFRNKRLNEWTAQESRWLDMAVWDACGDQGEPDYGEPCFGGLDLSSKLDISAFVLYWPQSGVVKPWFWVPEDNIIDRVRRDRVPYDMWAREGYLTLTPGNVIDYTVIKHDILQAASDYNIVDVAFDRWGATQITTELHAENVNMVEFGQGYKSMSPAMKEFEALLHAKKINHGGHPVLRWMASNLGVDRDPAENLKPNKAKSREKIDGMTALIMAIGRASTAPAKQNVLTGEVILL